MKNLIAFCVIIFSACGQAPEQPAVEKEKMMTVNTDSVKSELNGLTYAAKKDLVCKMPVSAGITDTLSYKGGLYGFCSSGCKEEFLKNPEQYLTAK